jgi:lipopolysaccharide export system permease protein
MSLTTSKSAEYRPPKWVLAEGTQTTFHGADHVPIAKPFTELELLIPEKPNDFQEIEKEVNRLRIDELVQFVKRNKEAGINTRSYEVQLHSRFSLSTSPIVMCLLAFPFSIRRNRSGGMAKALAICLGWTLFYWISFSFGLSFGQAGTVSPWLAAWSPSLIFLGLAMAFLSRPVFK